MNLIRKFDLKNAKTAGVDALGVTIGIAAGYQLAKLAKKNSLIVNLGITAVGAAVITMSPHPFAQIVGAGIAGFGFVKTLNNLASDTLTLLGTEEEVPKTNPIPEMFRNGIKATLPASLQGEGDYQGQGSSNDTRLDEAAVEVRAINGFNFSGSGLEMSGATNLMMS